jgi:hypothetical protein
VRRGPRARRPARPRPSSRATSPRRSRSRGQTAPEDLGRALSESGSSLEPREVARLAAERFGAQGVLVGNVARFRERREGVGEDRAASVWFEVSLYKAPEGERLWTGIFNETQRPLSHNVLVGARYPGGGSRWFRRRARALGC